MCCVALRCVAPLYAFMPLTVGTTVLINLVLIVRITCIWKIFLVFKPC